MVFPARSSIILISTGSMLSFHVLIVTVTDCIPIVTKQVKENVNPQSTDTVEVDTKGFYLRIMEAFNSNKPAEVARHLKLTRHSVYKWRKGESFPDLTTLIKISKLTNTSIHWLLTGDEPKYLGDQPLPARFRPYEQRLIYDVAEKEGYSIQEMVRVLVLEALKSRGLLTKHGQTVDLIFFGERNQNTVNLKLIAEISGGNTILPLETEKTVSVSSEFIHEEAENFAVRVSDDSLSSEGILKGDLLVCFRGHEPQDGQTVIAIIGGSIVTVKKYYLQDRSVFLEPLGTQHEPQVMMNSNVEIFGIVAGLQRASF